MGDLAAFRWNVQAFKKDPQVAKNIAGKYLMGRDGVGEGMGAGRHTGQRTEMGWVAVPPPDASSYLSVGFLPLVS